MMTNNNSFKNSTPEYSNIIRIQRFFRSNTGFRIGIILISFVIISLIEFGLILVFFIGDIFNVGVFMSYAKQRMILFNINEVTLNESTVSDVVKSTLFRIGFLALVFGIIIGIFSFRTSPQSTFQSEKRLQKYLSLVLIILGFLFLIIPF